MKIQVINALNGYPEYVLLPLSVYQALQTEIESKLQEMTDYIPFVIEDYLQNPVAVARIKMGITQKVLATTMRVSQAYISRLESQTNVSANALQKVMQALEMLQPG